MIQIDDVTAVLVDVSILEKYTRKLPELIDAYKLELAKKGWTSYQPYTDGYTLKYGIVKNKLIEEYDQLLSEAAGLFFEFSDALEEISKYGENKEGLCQ